MHWAAQYIGIPWLFGSDDVKRGLDCWGLFRHVQREQYGLDLPYIALTKYNYHEVANEFKTNAEFGNWYDVTKPQDGDGVVMRMAKYPNHVGLWIDNDGDAIGVLHTVQGIGAIFSTLQSLRLSGWKVASYHRHKSK